MTSRRTPDQAHRSKCSGVFALLLLGSVEGGGQGIHVGSVVRISPRSDSGHIQGTIIALGRDSLRLEGRGLDHARQIALRDIGDLQLRRKTGGHGATGSLIGIGVGAVTGIAIGLASGNDPRHYLSRHCVITCEGRMENHSQSAALKAARLAPTVGFTGALVGWVVGRRVPAMSWARIRDTSDLAFAVRGANATGFGPVPPFGTHVRVTLLDGTRLTGRLTGVIGDTLIIPAAPRPNGLTPRSSRIAAQDIAMIERSRSRPNALRGAVNLMAIGTFGAVLGGVTAREDSADNSGSCGGSCTNRADHVIGFVAVGAVAGAMYGAAGGLLVWTRRWEEVYPGVTLVRSANAHGPTSAVGFGFSTRR